MTFFKNTAVIASIVGVVILTAAAMPQEEPAPKNLKVLPKNIPHRQLDSVMRSYNVALGVKCNYCHARTEDGKHLDFASDAKHEKEMARNMIRMTEKLNKKYFEHTNTEHGVSMMAVSCYSCHHGEQEPAVKPAAKPKETNP